MRVCVCVCVCGVCVCECVWCVCVCMCACARVCCVHACVHTDVCFFCFFNPKPGDILPGQLFTHRYEYSYNHKHLQQKGNRKEQKEERKIGNDKSKEVRWKLG